MDFKNASSMQDLMCILLKNINNSCNNYNFGFGDYELLNMTDDIKMKLNNLLLNDVWVFDYTPYEKIKDANNNEYFTRTNLSAFVKRDFVSIISKNLSQNNILVCIHDHLSDNSCIYDNGKKYNITNEDLITKFKLEFNNKGNPSVINLEHICDYGSDIDLLKPILKEELFEYINNNYIEISVINKSFSDDLLLNKLIDVVCKI